MSDQAYRDGYKDGFADGLAEAKKQINSDNNWAKDWYKSFPTYLGSPNTCQVCGRLNEGVSGYVCFNPKCPGAVTCGAVGSTEPVTHPLGANGPAEKAPVSRNWNDLQWRDEQDSLKYR
jgi:hypothetical protein